MGKGGATFGNIQRANGGRVCACSHLISILEVGNQVLTGVFLSAKEVDAPRAPLNLVWCPECSIVQLRHSVDTSLIFGQNYGYRSGLNPTMVSHLERKARWLEHTFFLEAGDLVVDIGSNDGTLLNAYGVENLNRIGFDPVVSKYPICNTKTFKWRKVCSL
jgi:hypothetical protein